MEIEYLDTWKEMEKLLETGKVKVKQTFGVMHHQLHTKALGVSNFTIPQLEDLLNNCKYPPAVLQVNTTTVISSLLWIHPGRISSIVGTERSARVLQQAQHHIRSIFTFRIS
jgi:predicted oxidoreductase